MFEGQLEMSLNGQGRRQFTTRRQRRLNRAQWWFERMRQAVDRAIDWQPAPQGPPQQIWFPVARLQFSEPREPQPRTEKPEVIEQRLVWE